MKNFVIISILLIFTFNLQEVSSSCSQFSDCNKRGYCLKNACNCFDGFSGPNCENFKCESNCQRSKYYIIKKQF